MKDEMRIAAVGVALTTIALGSAPSEARPAGWPSASDRDVEREGSVIQATRTMSLDLPGSADAAFPLFGPVREREWVPDWNPSFVVPERPDQSPDGAVFTVPHDTAPAVWVMTDFDPAQRVVRYVVVRPGMVAIQLWIEVSPLTANSSRADVTYRYTLLGPDGRQPLDHFIQGFPHFKAHWEGAIGPVLTAPASAKTEHHP